MSKMFKLLSEANTPTVIGKAWWNEALTLSKGGEARRAVLIGAGVFGAFIFGPPIVGALFSDDGGDPDDIRRERRKALQAQREYGWSFGAADEAWLTGGYAAQSGVDGLLAVAAPKDPRWTPVWVPTLFESLAARPTGSTTPEDMQTAGFKPLRDVIVPALPIDAAIDVAEGSLVKDGLARFEGIAVVVDLAGPDAVVFAAALTDRFDPVFLFDNWPHPRGVVKAHETLAAALQMMPKLQQAKSTRPVPAPPAFILDRTRLAPYTDDASQFDNRSLARLPSLATLQAAGIKHVYYVAPARTPTNPSAPLDSDDVVDDLVAWQAAGIEVRGIEVETADVFGAATTDPARRDRFFAAYSLPSTGPFAAGAPKAAAWRPTPRSTQYAQHQAPQGFGEVPVVVRAASGIVLGAALYRNGSWNRAPVSSTYYGGG